YHNDPVLGPCRGEFIYFEFGFGYSFSAGRPDYHYTTATCFCRFCSTVPGFGRITDSGAGGAACLGICPRRPSPRSGGRCSRELAQRRATARLVYPAASTLEARKDALSDAVCPYVPRRACSQAAERFGAKQPSGAGIAG